MSKTRRGLQKKNPSVVKALLNKYFSFRVTYVTLLRTVLSLLESLTTDVRRCILFLRTALLPITAAWAAGNVVACATMRCHEVLAYGQRRSDHASL